MTKFLEVLKNIRIACAEMGGTITLIMLIAFGTYKAWEEFILKLLR
jgi:hypothetical protein